MYVLSTIRLFTTNRKNDGKLTPRKWANSICAGEIRYEVPSESNIEKNMNNS